jgi:hypothetical protein
MKRYIIVNTETGIADGLYLDRVFADKSGAALQKLWPGLQWEVEETTEPFPTPGRVCLGHVRAANILKRYQEQNGSE